VTTLETDIAGSLRYRPVRPDELETCAHVWRRAIDDYILRLAQPALPEEVGPLVRLYTHLQSTDPDRFVAAVRDVPDAAGEEIVGFGAAVARESLWYLSMLFVLPGMQGAGIGRALLDRIGPKDGDGIAFRGTATDSAQPISNALYASLGIVPRIPLLNLVGTPSSTEPFGELPSGVQAVPFEELAAGPPGGDGHRRLAEAVDDLDRELLGVAHPIDHRWLRLEGRRGWLYIGPDGFVLGYGYTGEVGRVGPVAVRDEALLAPVIGHLLGALQPRGAHALWLPGTADRAVVPALAAGLRLESFPLLLCWDRPFGDWSRYLPISPGLL
jgi:GNAT superfamily N-acetyltransferase